jgi:exo-beta-1,3-glucanase (GH17 family)
MLTLPSGRAICYSGYRRGQSPAEKVFPSADEIREDLQILHKHWSLLRLYDCSVHAERVLDVIRREGFDFKVMLGAYLGAEVNNFGCPWGGVYSEQQLDDNVERLIALAHSYRESVFSVAVGNETTADWTDHVVPVERMIEHVRRVRSSVAQPVTFCENYVPWQAKLHALVPELDFISLHTYPVWEYKHIHDAIHYTKDNYDSVARLYPDKPVVISEAGWSTASNGRGIQPHSTSQDLQQVYYRDLMDWSSTENILTFVFEAFDEPWKGSDDPLEPEKHWGLFTENREPKMVMQGTYPELLRER